jgi:hypothetical protein
VGGVISHPKEPINFAQVSVGLAIHAVLMWFGISILGKVKRIVKPEENK